MSFEGGPPGFTPADPLLPVQRTRRKLPHWALEGASYFVTFHLADSLPADKRRDLTAIRDSERRRPARFDRPEARPPEAVERMKHLESLLDAGAGACWFANSEYACLVSKALHHFNRTRYELYAWCVMPNHAHVLFKPLPGHELEDILHSWNSNTAHELNSKLGRSGTVWQEESFDTIVRDGEHLAKVVRYIGNNPAKACLQREEWHRWVEPAWAACGWGFAE